MGEQFVAGEDVFGGCGEGGEQSCFGVGECDGAAVWVFDEVGGRFEQPVADRQACALCAESPQEGITLKLFISVSFLN